MSNFDTSTRCKASYARIICYYLECIVWDVFSSGFQVTKVVSSFTESSTMATVQDIPPCPVYTQDLVVFLYFLPKVYPGIARFIPSPGLYPSTSPTGQIKLLYSGTKYSPYSLQCTILIPQMPLQSNGYDWLVMATNNVLRTTSTFSDSR